MIIAEDVKTILDKERSFLNRSDIRVLTAATNGKALELHRSHKAHLIIAKLDSTDMSGEQFCSIIREDIELRDVSIIVICSGAGDDLERCIKCRANAFFTAPLSIPAILEEAHQLLNIAPRTSWRIPVSVKVDGSSRKTPFIGFAENISTSGMFFRAGAVLFEGDPVKCSFSLPGSVHITAEAEIVRVLPREGRQDINGYGVRFTDLSDSAASALEAFLTRKTGK